MKGFRDKSFENIKVIHNLEDRSTNGVRNNQQGHLTIRLLIDNTLFKLVEAT